MQFSLFILNAINAKFYIINFLIILFLFSCHDKNIREGCTDCTAINYDSTATFDDSTCIFSNNNIFSTYAVKDSIMGPFLSWYFDEYIIEIKRDCSSNGIIIKNYGNASNSDGPLIVQGIAYKSSIFIPFQIIDTGKDVYSTDYIEVYENTGIFRNDSIFIDIEYMNRYDPFIGKLYGIKINN